MKATNETVHGGMSKTERYKWKVSDNPGEFKWIPKGEIMIDHTYQRNLREGKTLLMAKDWSWVACGAISVASRDGVYFAIDGQHRIHGALKRSDITVLPCMVFETSGAQEEAKGFLTAQTQRKPVTAIDKFRAMVVIEDPSALYVQSLIEGAGRVVSSGNPTNGVKCVGRLITLADTDKSVLGRIWPIVVEISQGVTIAERVVDGLFYIEKTLMNGRSITENSVRKSLNEIKAVGLMEAAQKASIFYSAGGAKIWANGMLQAINKGRRNRLEVANQLQ